MFIALYGNPSQSYGASPAIWDRTVLHAIRHRLTCPALTPAMQAGTRFTYPGGWKAELTLVVGYIPIWFTCPQTVTHPSNNHLIVTRPGLEPTTSRSQVQRPNRYATKQPWWGNDNFRLRPMLLVLGAPGSPLLVFAGPSLLKSYHIFYT